MNNNEQQQQLTTNTTNTTADIEITSPPAPIPVTRESSNNTILGIDWKTLRSFLGPGLLVSLGYLDPGNLESDLQNGAYTGYSLLGVLFWSTFIGLFLQILSARLGVVTGKNLAQHCRDSYSRRISFCLWIAIEFVIVGADIQEIIGTAIAFHILFKFPLWLGCLITVFDAFTLLAFHQSKAKKFELLIVTFISAMAICFFVTLTISGFNVEKALLNLAIPTVPNYGRLQAVGTLGAVVMPHNLFLHSALVTTRAINRNDLTAVHEACKYNLIESTISLFVAFLINAAVVMTFSHTFFDEECAKATGGPFARVYHHDNNHHHNTISITCGEIGLADSGTALETSLSKSARYVWAIGLLAAGQSSTLTGTVAGTAVMDGFLNLQLPPWQRLLLTRSIALIPSLFVALAASSSNRITDRVDELLNVLQSVQLPFALIPLLIFTNDVQIMGTEFVNGKIVKFFLYGLTFGVLAVNALLVFDKARGWLSRQNIGVLILFGGIACIYLGMIAIVTLTRKFMVKNDEIREPLLMIDESTNGL
jgi:NRAMP (natural resistance-associated macrophage protein)-like metal ion transporter